MTAPLIQGSLVALLALVTVADLREGRIPDRALLAATAVVIPAIALGDPSSLDQRLAAALAAGGLLLAAALARPEGMGLGDVKLIAVLGLYLGPSVFAALLLALLGGALAGLVLIARHGLAARRMTVPFAPFIALGTLLAAA